MDERPQPRHLGAYLLGVTGLGLASIGLLFAFFTADVRDFYRAFLEGPPGAISQYPGSALLIVGAVALLCGLLGLLVVFGVRYGPDPDTRQ